MLGRGLRLFPGKTECLVIDTVGNSAKHSPVQLASLAGFDPERKYAGGAGFGNEEKDDIDEPEQRDEVAGAKVGKATEVLFATRKPKSQYQWRETTLGWILQIPKIGYYLVAWSDKASHMATIRFFDQRTGRKHEPPREIVRQPIEFDMAYGLVEAEMDRIFHARSTRRDDGTKVEDDRPVASFVDLDEGTDEETVLPEEELMTFAKELGAPYELVKETKELGRLPVVNFAAGGIATPADAALMMQLGVDGVFVGSGIFKSGDPARRAKAIVEATTHYRNAEILARVSENLGEPMVGIGVHTLAPEQQLASRGW